MKRAINSLVFATVLTLGVATARAADPAPAAAVSPEGLPEGYVNVMEYITKVGNRTNHTEALRMAFKDTSKGNAKNGVGNRHFAVYFPPGNYIIDDTLKIDYLKIVGLNATITQMNPEKDIFSATNHAWMTSIQGITFRGGRDQIHIETGLHAAGILWRIIDCNFYDANGRAMFLSGNAFHAIVERGVIKGCKNGIMYAEGDSVVMRGFHGNTHLQTNAAAFDLRCGIFAMEDCLWTPQATHPDARWIDNRCAMLFLHHTHFGGESGGFTPIVNYSKPKIAGWGTLIHLDSCCFFAQSNLGKKTVVYCEEVPEVIHIQDCQIGGIEPIMVSPDIDLKNYFVQEAQILRPSYRIESCAGYLGDIPELLKNPVVRKDETAFLDDQKIAELMAAAVKSAGAMTTPAGGAEKPGECLEMISKAKRTEPTDPAKYVKASFSNCVMTGTADGEIIPNANYLAIQPVGANLIIMKRQFHTGNAWVFLKDFTVDLDKYPFLTRKIKSESYRVKSGFPPIRVIDRKSGQMTLFGEDNQYSAIDLRKVFGGGVHTLDLRLYWSASVMLWLAKDESKASKDYDGVVKECPKGNQPPGSYLVYEYIRAEAE